MRGAYRWLVVAAVVLGSALPTAGHTAPATQMDAADQPHVEGPLTLENQKCDKKVRSSGGETVAVVKRCLRYYKFDPGSESDAERDFGIVWLQSNVDAKNGWCAKRVASDVLLPEGLDIVSFKPKGLTEISETREYLTRLPADAGNSASTRGRVSQSWIAYRQKVRGVIRDEGRIFRLKWAGSSAAKLGFASGVQIAWRPDNPPEGISYQLNFSLASPDAC